MKRKIIIIIFLCMMVSYAMAHDNMKNIRKIIEDIGSHHILYLRILPQPSACIIAINPHNISQSAMALEYTAYQDLVQPPLSGEIMLIDDLKDVKLDLFSKQYTIASFVLKKIDEFLLEKNNIDSEWNISEIGYTVVNDEKNPWRWATTFIKEVDHKIEKKSFIFENGAWVFQKQPIINYYFAPFLDDLPVEKSKN